MAEHGGKREGAGRKAVLPEVGPTVDKGIATRVLARPYETSDHKVLHEEDWWYEAIWMDPDKDRQLRARIYLTDKRDGKPAQGVFVGDTRESTRELDLGNLPMPASPKPRTAGKPN